MFSSNDRVLSYLLIPTMPNGVWRYDFEIRCSGLDILDLLFNCRRLPSGRLSAGRLEKGIQTSLELPQNKR